MQHERLLTINNEDLQSIRSAIFGTEIATLLPEHAAMFNAENDACFTHFIDTLPEDMRAECDRAKDGDHAAILAIGDAYHEFRDLFESTLAAQNPDAYNEFIESVASGDVDSANAIVSDFTRMRSIADSPVIDDELDAQFT